MTIEAFTVLLVFALACIWAWNWLRQGTPSPDPWDSQVTESLEQETAEPLCYHCLAPQKDIRWFCEECGAAVGPYNNYDPYAMLFSEGQLLRTGVLDKLPRRRPVVIIGYFLLPLTAFFIFAPIYWFFLIRNLTAPTPVVPDAPEPQV
jgi:hypothetical protein